MMVVTYVALARRIVNVPPAVFFTVLTGIVVGLAVGALVAVPLSRLEDPFGRWLPLIVDVFAVVTVTTVFYLQRTKIAQGFNQMVHMVSDLVHESITMRILHKPVERADHPLILDTSAVIDGRILELVKTGFLWGRIMVPQFVLDELRLIADSEDSLRRNKGRRGLEILNDLKRESDVTIDVVEEDFLTEPGVDSKLVRLARKHKGRLMTVDYNLNQVAQVQNVPVLNINELSNALRVVALPGEILKIQVLQQGKDAGQGIGYLQDGTMVVVEGGDKFIGQEKDVTVTRVFQTVAGKMIFSVPTENEPAHVR